MDGQTREGEAFGLKPNQAGATWTGSPKNVFAGRKHHKPQAGLVASELAVKWDALLLLVVTLHVRVFASVNL